MVDADLAAALVVLVAAPAVGVVRQVVRVVAAAMVEAAADPGAVIATRPRRAICSSR